MLGYYIFFRLGTFKKVATDYLYQVGVNWVQHERKVFRVHLSSLAVSVIQRILQIHVKGSRFTGLSELIQLFRSSIGEVDVSVTKMSRKV